MANDTAHDLAVDLLNEAVVALTCAGITPPAIQFVGHADPAWDCELLSTFIDPAVYFPLSSTAPTCQVAPRITVNLTDVRCWPTQNEDGSPPTPAELTAAAELLNSDLWVLMRTLARHTAEGDLFDGVSCHATRLGPITTLPPQGGFAGWKMAVVVQPEDTDPLCGS